MKKFTGYMDPNRSRIRGNWKYDNDDRNLYFFDFVIAAGVKGTLHMEFTNQIGQSDATEEVVVNFKDKEIKQAPGAMQRKEGIKFCHLATFDQGG